jgi:hypothetical protein
VGVTGGSREVPGRNPVTRDNNDNTNTNITTNNNNIIRDNKIGTCTSILIGASIS